MNAEAPARRREALLLAVTVGLIGLVGAWNHELWRDEAEIWLLARDSATPGDLLTNMDWSERRREVPIEIAMREAIHMAREDNREIALVLNYGPGDLDIGEETTEDGVVIRHTHRFEGAMVPTENYYLYVVFPADR